MGICRKHFPPVIRVSLIENVSTYKQGAVSLWTCAEDVGWLNWLFVSFITKTSWDSSEEPSTMTFNWRHILPGIRTSCILHWSVSVVAWRCFSSFQWLRIFYFSRIFEHVILLWILVFQSERTQKTSEKQMLREVLASVRCEVVGDDAWFLNSVEM